MRKCLHENQTVFHLSCFCRKTTRCYKLPPGIVKVILVKNILIDFFFFFFFFSGALGVKEITKRLNLSGITNRQWVVQGACALTGSGIGESMESLAKLVRDFKGHKR